MKYHNITGRQEENKGLKEKKNTTTKVSEYNFNVQFSYKANNITIWHKYMCVVVDSGLLQIHKLI